MNSPNETLPRTYESEIVPLRERIDAIDAKLIHTLLVIQEFIHHEALGEAVIHTILSDDGFDEYREILKNILRTLKNIPKNGLSILHNHNLEGDEMLELLKKVNSLLKERFKYVIRVGELKSKFQKPAMDNERWQQVLTDRKEKWTQKGGKDANKIIPAIWNPIHKIAKDIEQQIIESNTPPTHIPHISQNVAAIHSYTPILGQVLSIGQHGGIYVKNTENSPILQSHFQGMPVLPGVLSSHLLLTLLSSEDNNTIHHYKRTFHNPIKPGTHILQGTENTATLVDENGSLLTTFSLSKDFPEFSGEIPSQTEINHKGSEWVPHGDDFRFVDFVGCNENQLFGEYLTTEKYLTESGNIPFWLIEESCAQMMLGAYRASQGAESGFGTYAESETRGGPYFTEISSKLKPGMQVRCTGKCLPIQDAKGRVSQLGFQYSCFVDGELFFQGNIVGNLIPKKLWERMTKKPS